MLGYRVTEMTPYLEDAVQRQTAITDYFLNYQLLLYVLKNSHCCLPLMAKHHRALGCACAYTVSQTVQRSVMYMALCTIKNP